MGSNILNVGKKRNLFLISQNTFADLKGPNGKKIICTLMDDERGDFLGPPHGTLPTAVIANKNKTEII